MTTRDLSRRVLELCDLVLTLDSEERELLLERECAGDSRLRASVDSVLMAIDDADGFLGVEPQSVRETSLIGKSIGKYTIMEKIGEGGMGAVYLAERRDADYKQTVAIKLVRGHLLARDLIKRFESERKILATLNHPYIASLIDGGTTEDGSPYLVMEYIDGKPLDRFCDEKRLGVRERLKLVQKVAMAVQYAHQNLVVHRDLKPSNVLVTPDGIPKLLDFGIAKLLGPAGAAPTNAATDHTATFGRQALTPEYASPEQILDGKATTASDVYSLGVLTYELLVGRRPYRVDTKSRRELTRFVEHLSVPRPSTRLRTIDSRDDARAVAAQRSTTPQRLERSLEGDLDTILLMALKPDAERRYASAAQLSEELQRYLDGLPVQARADSFGYRASRFVKRNRIAVGSAALVTLSLLAGAAGFEWQAREAAAQRDIARREAKTAEGAVEFLKTVLSSANPWEGRENEATVSDVMRYAEKELEGLYADDPGTKAYLLASISEIFAGRGEFEKAETHARSAVELVESIGRQRDPDSAYVYRVRGLTQSELSDNESARDSLARAIALYERQTAKDPREYASALSLMGVVQSALGEEAEAEISFKRALAVHEQEGLNNSDQLQSIYNNLAVTLGNQGKLDEAQATHGRAAEAIRAAGASDPMLATTLANRAGILALMERNDEAELLYREAMALQAGSLGVDHPEALITATSLGNLYEKIGEFEKAESILRPTLERASESLPKGHFITAYVQNVLGLVLCDEGKPDEGLPMLRSALGVRKALLPEGHWAIASAENTLGSCLTMSGDYDHAEPLLVSSYETLRDQRGKEHALTRRAARRLVTLYDGWGRSSEADPYR